MDVLTKLQRSRCMAAVRPKNTSIELAVKKVLKKLNVAFRQNVKALPGTPDVVIPHLKKVIFVHGCYWHRHTCSKGKSVPRSNVQFWLKKLNANVKRDRSNRATLIRLGWKVLVIWECQTADVLSLQTKLRSFCENPRRS
jgi:DNA mismatch endonuclease (patch repair protein)